MRKIRIAQIGMNFNSHSSQIFRSIAQQSDIFEVVGYALPEGERERLQWRMKDLDGYPELTLEEILNDPTIEAVTIETDEIYTTKYAIMAAEHGKHIHMEKPGGCELEDFEKLIEVMRRTGKVFHTGYMYRYNPCVIELMEKVRSGKMGEIISVEAQMNCWHTEKVRRWLGGLPGGMMFYLGCHLVDLVLQIQGMPDNIIPLNRATGLDGLNSVDYGMAVLEYKNGVSFVKSSAAERGGYMRRQLVVTGTECTVEIKPFEYGPESAMRTEQTVCTDPSWGTRGEHTVTDEFSRYDAMLASFGEMVRGEKENPWTLDYELTLYKTVLKCCGVNV